MASTVIYYFAVLIHCVLFADLKHLDEVMFKNYSQAEEMGYFHIRKNVINADSNENHRKNSGMFREVKIFGGIKADVCHKGCTCSDHFVVCSGSKLTFIPVPMPSMMLNLQLDGNDIKTLKKHQLNYSALKSLDLSHNVIQRLRDDIFSGLSSLQTLLLGFNSIECIHSSAFNGLNSLRLLSLQNNRISNFKEGVFNPLLSIKHLAIGGNPLVCDCKLKWLSEWLKNGFKEAGTARCFEPLKMKGQLLLTTSSQDFLCSGVTSLDKCSPCYTNPCFHGGTCHDFSEELLTNKTKTTTESTATDNKLKKIHEPKLSISRDGVKETHLQGDVIDDDDDDDDDDSDEDDKDEDGDKVTPKYKCSCPSEYLGRNCEFEINSCLDEPCSNNSTCIPDALHGRFKCVCSSGYRGERCQLVENSSSSSSPPPPPPAAASSSSPPPPAAAVSSSSPPPPAASSSSSPPPPSSSSPSSSSTPTDSSSESISICSFGQQGNVCLNSSIYTFTSHESFISLPLHLSKRVVTLGLNFSTLNSQGLILLNDEVAVELELGLLVVSCNFRHLLRSVFREHHVSDGRPHKLLISIMPNKIRVQLDGLLPRTFVNDVNYDVIEEEPEVNENEGGRQMYVGGLPEQFLEFFSNLWDLKTSTSFKGCLLSLQVNSIEVDLHNSSDVTRYKVRRGCRLYDLNCSHFKCKRGVCRMTASSSVTSRRVPACVCPHGYFGKHCEIEPTCQTLHYEDFYVDPVSKCRSRLRLEQRRCLGSCDSKQQQQQQQTQQQKQHQQQQNLTSKSCCQPKKLKQQAVSLVCPDGSTFNTRVALVRNCQCFGC